MFLERSSLKAVHRIRFHQRLGLPWEPNGIFQKCSLLEPLVRFWNNVSWVTFLKNCSQNFDLNKHGSGEWGLLAQYRHEEILKSSSLELLVRFWNNFTEMFLGWPFAKIVHKILISTNMTLVNWGYLHYTDMKKFLKVLLLWKGWSDFEIIIQKCTFGDPFQKLFILIHQKRHRLWWLLAIDTI